MKLPDVREEMHKMASDLQTMGLGKFATKLAKLAEETRRRSPVKRAPPRANSMTDEVKELIRRTARDYPHASLREIGRRCNVDQGRVSEVLRGFRQ